MRVQSQQKFRPRWVVSLEKRLLGLLRPIDLLRRRLTRWLQVGAAAQEVHRGGEVEALVTISNTRGLSNVEVGLVCTEYYARESEGFDDAGGRAITYAIAHADWLPVDCTPGAQSVRLTIPTEAPFSYEGDCLSFRWEIVARGRRRRWLDAQASHDISVLP
jgi:hypothetical protein